MFIVMLSSQNELRGLTDYNYGCVIMKIIVKGKEREVDAYLCTRSTNFNG